MTILEWQQVIDESSFSEADLYLIAAESPYFEQEIVSNTQFAQAGQKFLDLAQDLDFSSQRWLQNWLNASYGATDCVVPHDWLDWLATRTQQVVSVAFLDKYSNESREFSNYPENRVSWSEAAILDDVDLDLQSVLAVSHTEEIELWTSIVTKYLQSCDRLVPFSQLTQNIPLSFSQIYLGVLLNETVEIVPDDDFYAGFWVSSCSQS